MVVLGDLGVVISTTLSIPPDCWSVIDVDEVKVGGKVFFSRKISSSASLPASSSEDDFEISFWDELIKYGATYLTRSILRHNSRSVQWQRRFNRSYLFIQTWIHVSCFSEFNGEQMAQNKQALLHFCSGQSATRLIIWASPYCTIPVSEPTPIHLILHPSIFSLDLALHHCPNPISILARDPANLNGSLSVRDCF